MAKSRPTYLRLHAGEERPADFALSEGQQTVLDAVSSAFQSCTGLELRMIPASAPTPPGAVASFPILGVGDKLLGAVQAIAPSRKFRLSDAEGAEELGAAVALLLSELSRTQEALWQREAELAAGVPVTPHREAEAHLAERLEAILRGGAEAVGCQAAALYLLNADTSHLKVRSVYGLPRDRLAKPPRSLGGAIADLEALLGHAIVLNDRELLDLWSVPEPFRAACCLPVSTPTIPLGTVWFFCNAAREFTDSQVGILEIIAGRISAELEREALLNEATASAGDRFQADALGRMLEEQLPRLGPLSDAWSVAGWTAGRIRVAPSFHDWAGSENDTLLALVGGSLLAQVQGRGVNACDALLTAIVRTAARAFLEQDRDPASALRRVNQLLCSLSPGEHAAELAIAQLHGEGVVRIASAGRMQMIWLSTDANFRACGRTTPALGGDPDQAYLVEERRLAPGEALALWVANDTTDADEAIAWQAGLARELIENRSESRKAVDLARAAERLFDRKWGEAPTGHASLVVVQRRR